MTPADRTERRNMAAGIAGLAFAISALIVLLAYAFQLWDKYMPQFREWMFQAITLDFVIGMCVGGFFMALFFAASFYEASRE